MVSASSTPSRRDLWNVLAKLAPVVALVLLVVVLCIFSEPFRKPENFVKIVNQWSFVGIVAIGMTWVIIVGGIDLSVGSMVALLAGAGMMAMNRVYAQQVLDALPAELRSTTALADVLMVAPSAVKDAVSIWPAVGAGAAIMLIGGGLLGLLNGLGITVGRLAPFIATLGTMAIYRSLILAPTQGSEIRGAIPAFGEFAAPQHGVVIPLIESSRGRPLVATWPIILFFSIAVVAELSLRCTSFGRQTLAIGDNPAAARYAGIRVGRVTTAVYVMSGILCGVAALLNASRLNSVSSSQTGMMYELDAIAAVVIGGTSMRGGSGWIIGTVVGVLLLGVIDNMLLMLDVNTHLQGLVKGCIIIAAVLFQRSRAAR
ncbi:MAG: ABC transporter permease [Phycisphaerales bacterium]